VHGSVDPKRHNPLIDLDMVRETLAHIRDDLQRIPALGGAVALLSLVLAEVDAAERCRLAPIPGSILDAGRLRRRRH
jgi:hypothetical protein